MPKWLIVNADEFGLTEAVNLGIVEGFRRGIVTTTTMIVNMWAFDHAVALQKDTGLPMGVHLNLSDGRPVLPATGIPTLVDRQGMFWKRPILFRRLLRGRVALDEVEQELRAQVEKVIRAGITPSHLDSHQHTYIHPGILRRILMLARELGLPLRSPKEEILFEGMTPHFRHWASIPYYKKLFRSVWGNVLRTMIRRAGVLTTDRVISISGCFRHDKYDVTLRTYEALLGSVRDGTTELMTHPGYVDERLIRFVWEGAPEAYRRERELSVLLDPSTRGLIERHKIVLTNYRELFSGAAFQTSL